MKTMSRKTLQLLIWIVPLVLCAASCTSADEAEQVQVGLGEQAHAAAMATAGSAQLDLQATATAHDIALQAQATAVYAQVQLTAQAAPAIATAGAQRRDNKTAASNNMTSALAMTVMFTLPMVGLLTLVAYWRYARKVGIIRVKKDEMLVVGAYIVDGATGAVRLLSQASEQLPGRVAVQITYAAQQQLSSGGDWIEGVVSSTREWQDESSRGRAVETRPAQGPNLSLGSAPE